MTMTTPTGQLDHEIKELNNHKDEWARLPIPRKIELLEEVKRLAAFHAEEWVAIGGEIKGLAAGAPQIGEEWASGPWALLTTLHLQLETLHSLAKGESPPLVRRAVRTRRDGQVTAKVFPANIYDRLLFNGYSAEVWMQRGITANEVTSTMATFYKDPAPAGSVGLILGAGNITSIAPLDVIYKMFGEGRTALLKMHPLNDPLGPVFEAILAPLIDAGYAALCYGGADIGEYLCRHDGIDAIHVTGGAKTHDAIVFGSGSDGAARRERNEPLTDKTVTSELGNVTPTIVVPGPWTDRDIAYQAEHLATQKLHNAGFNCIASQVLVLPEQWEEGPALVEALKETMRALPQRDSYYPQAAERQRAFASAYPDAELLGGDVPLTFISGLDATSDEYCFHNEAFAPVYGQTSLPGADATEFLSNAVDFCNDKLWGTLASDILIHPKTIKELGPKLGDAIGRLRYGTVGVNAWDGVGFLLGLTPWGAFPGETDDHVQSGIGVVHNTLLFSRPEKSVVYGPFRPFPRTLASGSFHLSPKPQWFVTNRQSKAVGRKITNFVADPGIRHLPGLFASALRG